MRRRRRERQNLGEAEVNLTPLIDVCFVTLIMFIVIAPLLEMEQVELASGPPLKTNGAVTTHDKNGVSIYVHKDDTLSINGRAVSLSELKEELSIANRLTPNAIPQLFHDRNAKFGTYQAIKNAVEAAGFKELNLILKPE
jgi:biopolymer transport protein ExbD